VPLRGRALNPASAASAAREKFINASFRHLAGEYAGALERQSEVHAAHAAAATRVTGLSNELRALNDALEDVKGALEDRGSSMTDTSPLIKIKAALSALRAEAKTMDLHIGVVGHAVMQVGRLKGGRVKQSSRGSRHPSPPLAP